MAVANYSLTAAAERAIEAAWRYVREETASPGSRELLLSLCDEPECRAVGMLKQRGLESLQVHQRWGESLNGVDIAAPHAARPTSRAIRRVISHAVERLS